MGNAASRRPWWLVAPLWLTMGMLLLLPQVIVLIQSFAQRGPYGGVAPVPELMPYLRSGEWWSNYAQTGRAIYLAIFWRSIWMAVLTTVLCLLVSYPVAYYIALLARPRHKTWLLALTVLPFWTSFLIRTYAWMLILRTHGLVNESLTRMHLIQQPLELLYNDWAVMIGLVYGELPFMILPIYATLEKLDRTLLEASGDLGARRWETFRRVTLPLSAPGIAAGVILVFVPSIGQFIVSDVLGGAKSILVGNLIQNQYTSSRNQPFGAALSIELTLIVLAGLLLYAWYARRRWRGEG